MRSSLAGVVAVAIGLGLCPPAHAAAPGSAAGSDQPAGKRCVSAEEARVRAAGDSGGEPQFTAAFYRRRFLLNVSLDGEDGNELPISIEEVCSVPKRLKKQAAQLAGGDGVALLLARTTVWQGDTQLTGQDAMSAVGGADTATMRVRLLRPAKWREDEDGNRIPTFRTGRMEITD